MTSSDALLHQLLALRAQLGACLEQVESMLSAVPTCEHPQEQRQYLTGFGVTPRRYICGACGCEIEEDSEDSEEVR